MENNQHPSVDPRSRRLGRPIRRAAVESLIKQLNGRRNKDGAVLEGGAAAELQVRTAYVSEDGRAGRDRSRPRQHHMGRWNRSPSLLSRTCKNAIAPWTPVAFAPRNEYLILEPSSHDGARDGTDVATTSNPPNLPPDKGRSAPGQESTEIYATGLTRPQIILSSGS